MSELVVSIQCPIAGMEAVTVVYDMMATEAQLDAALRKMGKADTYKGIIARIDGWPAEYGEPFGADTPIAFCVWAVREAWREALTQFISAPNF